MAIALGLAALAAHAWPRPPGPGDAWAAEVPRVLRSDKAQYFNVDRRVRVEYANIVVTERKAVLEFEAAAMVRARFPDQTGPWVVVALLDREGRVIGPFKQVLVASVNDCGGYQRHRVEVTNQFPGFIQQAAGFTIRMPGKASPQPC